MIDRERMMEPMLNACPSFRPTWNEFTDEWRNEPEMPLYSALGDLARHLTAMLAEGQTASFPAIFDVIERWHVEGDAYVSEAATVGLLEGLHNATIHETTEPEQFRLFMLPQTERWWDKLYEFWNEGKILTDD